MSVIVGGLALASCATSYQSKGLTGGYEDRQINERSFEVWFHGNGYTSGIRTEQGAMRRSAELTVARNMAGFAIVQDRSTVNVSTWHQPVSCTTQEYGATQTTSCSGGDETVRKPSAHMVIYMLTGPEAFEAVSKGQTVFDAGRLLGLEPLIPVVSPSAPAAAYEANSRVPPPAPRVTAPLSAPPPSAPQHAWTPAEILSRSPDRNPEYSASLNPKYNSSLNPEYNPSVNPEYNSSLNPKYNPSLNPKYNSQLNPKLNLELVSDLPRRVVYFLFDTDAKVLGLFAFGSKDCLLFMDSDGDWKGYAVSDQDGGFNVFRNNEDWWAYVRQAEDGGVNIFAKKSGDWIGFGVPVRPKAP